jgi:hypothetical protein
LAPVGVGVGERYGAGVAVGGATVGTGVSSIVMIVACPATRLASAGECVEIEIVHGAGGVGLLAGPAVADHPLALPVPGVRDALPRSTAMPSATPAAPISRAARSSAGEREVLAVGILHRSLRVRLPTRD